jgi:uncharacterized protein
VSAVERVPPHVRAALLETRAVYRKADAAYARHACPGCGECCQLRSTGRQPWLWPNEWRLVVDYVRATRGELPPPRADGGCPFLDPTGTRCTVHPERPFGCRTYFCEAKCTGPAHQPTQTVVELSRRLEAAAAQMDPENEDATAAGPRPLMDWYLDR